MTLVVATDGAAAAGGRAGIALVLGWSFPGTLRRLWLTSVRMA